MTPLRSPVTRLTPVRIHDGGKTRSIVVTLLPDGIYLRQHRRRTAYHLPYEAAYACAAKLAAIEAAREKARKR